jgi:hypothetical protein
MKAKPNISSRAFGHTEFELLDFEQNAKYIILGVAQNGKDADFTDILDYYGKDFVYNILKNECLEIATQLKTTIENDFNRNFRYPLMYLTFYTNRIDEIRKRAVS